MKNSVSFHPLLEKLSWLVPPPLGCHDVILFSECSVLTPGFFSLSLSCVSRTRVDVSVSMCAVWCVHCRTWNRYTRPAPCPCPPAPASCWLDAVSGELGSESATPATPAVPTRPVSSPAPWRMRTAVRPAALNLTLVTRRHRGLTRDLWCCADSGKCAPHRSISI